MFMVKSTLVYMTCLVNGVILTSFLLLNIFDAFSENRKFSSTLSLLMYLGGVVFNTLVVLHAHRKLQAISKKTKYYLLKYLLFLSKGIEKIQGELDGLLIRLLSGYGSRIVSRTVLRDLSNASFPSDSPEVHRVDEAEPLSTSNQETSQELNTPDMTSDCDQKSNFRTTRSDPLKKPVKLLATRRSLRVQSPELFKNKIYKSRMNLLDDSESAMWMKSMNTRSE